MNKTDENYLIDLCKNDSLNHFTDIYELYVEKIYNFVFYKTLNKEISEDITSQTFYKVLESIKSFDSSKGNFSMWIYSIARNLVNDHFRKYKNTFDVSEVWDMEDEDQNVEENSDVNFTYNSLKPYIKELNNKQREILFLRIWQDLSFKEIAEIVEVSEGAAKMNLKRTLEHLRSKLPLNLLLLILFKIL